MEDVSIRKFTSINLMILSGPIRSGKSSRLFEFYKNRENTAGIISLVINNKRYLYSIRTKEKKLLEADAAESDTNVINVGKYNFSKEVFAWGRKILEYDLKHKPSLIIIDEIGPLELLGEGLAPPAFEIVNESLADKQKVLVVVRESLVKKFLERVHLKDTDVKFLSLESF
jgi:nucleoside-triphosphatase THEP1